MKNSKTVEDYIGENEAWTKELLRLRKALKSLPLTETVKWGAPCYTYEGKNLVGMLAFKSYFGLWFHQGALLADTAGVLLNAQEGKTKALRQWRMTSAKDINVRTIKAYVHEAIALQKEGKVIKPERNKPIVIPPQLAEALASHPKAKAAFDKMTKGKRRSYADYISDAKREATKASRVLKILPMITAGVGLEDKYKNPPA